MKETERRRVPNNRDRKHSARADIREQKPVVQNVGKNVRSKEIDAKAFSDALGTNDDAKTIAKPLQIHETNITDNVDEVSRSEGAFYEMEKMKIDEKEINEKLSDNSSNWEDESREGTLDESDVDTVHDSTYSHGDSIIADEDKAEKVGRSLKNVAKNSSSNGSPHAPKSESVSIRDSKGIPRKEAKPDTGSFRSISENTLNNSKNMRVHPNPLLDTSEGDDDKPLEPKKEQAELDQKIEDMETRVKQLEDELREVAALEISLYSVVPEHSNSAHKVHTPARRISRLYIYASKFWSQDKRAAVARNTVSGLVLVAKSCGNDVSRLTFWLSNTVILREIISQAFGSSCKSSALAKTFESTGGGKKNEIKFSSLRRKTNNESKQINKQSFLQFVDDWQESRTFTAALEKIESWIFSRIVESIWWQTLTPNMQSLLVHDSKLSEAAERFLGPALGDQQQGNFSINLWKNAFQDSLKRLCPLRSVGSECGCLSLLSRKVMEQCVGRLDVAMFNAILRESAHEIPTDPISDPIVESKVLPIPAGDLSFGSGAQLKNSVGHWARWLANILGNDSDSFEKDKENSSVTDAKWDVEPIYFPLLITLSDLLMLPKDMLMDRTIRMEVCPLISLPLVKRVLCNFTPDEFCPDPVPGAVLEALNAECKVEWKLLEGSITAFPYTASPVVYIPPSSNLPEARENSKLSRSSSLQRKGHTSDEELDHLESCPTWTIDKLLSSPKSGIESHNVKEFDDEANVRYELLREVWLSTD